jgi:hypothetical protein
MGYDTLVGRVALLLAVVLGALGDSCGAASTDSTAAGFHAPCERSGDCALGLVCEAGVCISPEANVSDGGGGDNSRDSGFSDGSTAD